MTRPLLLLLIGLATATADPRSWTDVKGRKIEAEFVSQTADKVTLKLASGKDVTLLKTQLSAEDREFLKTASAAPATQKECCVHRRLDNAPAIASI